MALEKKKVLASRTLGVGKNRLSFNTSRLAEIKEAITKQDVRDLLSSGAIIIKEKKGRRKIIRRKTRRRSGSIKNKVNNRKREYITATRKLRSHLKSLKSKKIISNEEFIKLRKEIRARFFKNLSHMKEHISQTKEAK